MLDHKKAHLDKIVDKEGNNVKIVAMNLGGRKVYMHYAIFKSFIEYHTEYYIATDLIAYGEGCYWVYDDRNERWSDINRYPGESINLSNDYIKIYSGTQLRFIAACSSLTDEQFDTIYNLIKSSNTSDAVISSEEYEKWIKIVKWMK